MQSVSRLAAEERHPLLRTNAVRGTYKFPNAVVSWHELQIYKPTTVIQVTLFNDKPHLFIQFRSDEKALQFDRKIIHFGIGWEDVLDKISSVNCSKRAQTLCAAEPNSTQPVLAGSVLYVILKKKKKKRSVRILTTLLPNNQRFGLDRKCCMSANVLLAS